MLGALSLALLAPLFFLSRSFRLTPSFAFMFVHKTTKKRNTKTSVKFSLCTFHTHTLGNMGETERQWVSDRERGVGKGKGRREQRSPHIFVSTLCYTSATPLLLFSFRHVYTFPFFIFSCRLIFYTISATLPNLTCDFCKSFICLHSTHMCRIITIINEI